MTPPTPKQARILWVGLTALAAGVVLALVGAVVWATAWLVRTLSSVLLPLALAGILACLLDPVVDFFERRLVVPRTRAILMVFFLGVTLVMTLLVTVVPQLVVETSRLATDFPDYITKAHQYLSETLAKLPLGVKATAALDSNLGVEAQDWLEKALPVVSEWLLHQVTRVASWAGLLAGFALVPVYVFYFLLEKRGIQERWTDYLPIRESWAKQELVFVLSSIRDCLVLFFRGQVLVSLCSGTMLSIGFMLLGLHYGLLLGALAAMLGIVPYLGVMISLVPAVILALVQFGDWWHPLAVLAIFGAVQSLEGLVVSPRLMGQRVGLHPLTIIIAVMVGTTLLGGILGGLLAIPLTAALRTLMFRYVWKRAPRATA